MMRILVCIKQVAHLYSRLAVDSIGKIDPDGLVYIVNPHDEAALEEALRIKQSMGYTEVTLISMGPSRVEKALRYGLAMGANQAIHICDENLASIDPWMISKALAQVIETQSFDLIVCGKKAIDDNEGVVGGFVAEWLNLPYISSVAEIAITPDGKRASMYRILGGGDRQLMECELPALFSIEGGLTKPRYPILMSRLMASKKEIIKVHPGKLEIRSSLKVEKEMKFERLSAARPKPKMIFVPNSNLPAEERIKLIMSGGLVEKKGGSMEGSPQELSKQFINFLRENRILRKREGLANKEEAKHGKLFQIMNEEEN